MDIDRVTEQILEITNNSDYGWIDLDSADADRIRVALTKALTIPVVVGQSEQLFCDTCKNKKSIAYWHETGMGLKPCHCTETK